MRAIALLTVVGSLLAVSACSTKYETMTPQLQASMLADLQAGKLNLDCGVGCSLSWATQVNRLHALDIAEQWNDLATGVMQIGYGSDLAYYYLGQAAQGLGDQQAALVYYGYALGLATGQNGLLKCEAARTAGNDACQGVDLASSIPVLMQASRDAIAQQQQAEAEAQAASAAPPVHHHHKRPSSSNTAAGWVAPPPAAAATPSSP